MIVEGGHGRIGNELEYFGTSESAELGRLHDDGVGEITLNRRSGDRWS